MAQLLPQLRDALQKRQTEFRGQLETITGKTVRRQLEADLGLAKKSLDAIKEQIDVLINEILLEPEQGAQAEEVKSKAGSRTKASAGRAKGKKGGDDDGEEEEEEEGPGSEEEEEGAARKRGSKGAKPAPGAEEEVGSGGIRGRVGGPAQVYAAGQVQQLRVDLAVVAAPAKKYSGKVEKLRNICRLASVKIPPGVYKAKSDAGVEEGLQALLSKHGLNASSSEAKISQV
ncbi:hypothetical protein QJQ45_019491 [Haematococcus lacustris]|nr:hypothetical protein QJQ45_019491 [Haematococcus lacustris]